MSIITDPLYRERVAPDVIVGERVNDVLGEVTPDQSPLYAQPSGYYKYHQGDLFFPGAPMWVLEQTIETPLMAQWGNGLLLAPNRGFQAFPPIPPIRTPDNLIRVATPWGMASPQWGINPVPEISSESPDQAGLSTLPNIDFRLAAPEYSLQSPTADYGTPQGYAQNSAQPVTMTDFPPNGIANAMPFQDTGVYSANNDGSTGAGGATGDY